MHYTVAFFFWFAFLIPGFALVMRKAPKLTRGGLMATLSVSFLGSIALIMPLTIVGFLLNLPVSVISGFIVLATAWGLFDIVKSGHWKDWKNQCAGILRIETIVLGVACAIVGKIGSLMGADALIHMARVRQFLDHGLTNIDPFVKGGHFYPIYHTNVFHVLLASCSQLTDVHYLDVWFGALPVFLILIASAIYFMTYQVFANRWAAWFAALFFVVEQGHINFLTYPNKISPFLFIPLLIGLVIRALRDKPTKTDALFIGANSLALGMIHGMYAFFGVILVGPIIAAFAVRSRIRKEGVLMNYALCLLALCLSMPWPMISRAAQDEARIATIRARIERDRDPNAIHFATANTGKTKRHKKANQGSNAFFLDAGWGMIMKKPFRGFGGGKGILGIPGFRYQYLMLGLALGLFSRRKKQYLIAASVSLVTLGYLLFPPLCTLLFNIMEAKWMLQRLETAGLSMMMPTLVFAPMIFFLSRFFKLKDDASWKRRTTYVLLQGLISILLLSLAFTYSNQWKSLGAVTRGSPWVKNKRSWYENYRFVKGRTAKECQTRVRMMKRQRKFFQETIPPGSNVIVTDNLALELVTLHDAHILDPIRSSVGVPDLSYTRRLNKRILNPITDWDTRRRILNQVETNIYIPQRASRWLQGYAKETWKMRQGNVKLVKIELDPKKVQ